jgi:inosine-uridine nucleoside N-ribohydrolase
VVTTRHLHVAIETRGEFTLGRTVMDVSSRSGREPNCHVALSADREEFVAMLKRVFGQSPSRD